MDNLILFVMVAAVSLGVALIVAWLMRPRAADNTAIEGKMTELAKVQAEIVGRFSQAIQSQSQSQGDLTRTVNERLDALDRRLAENLKTNAEKTAEVLGGLQQRLETIDAAQKSLTDLSSGLSTSVLGLQRILSDKQARGAFGQGQMEAIIRDALPSELYAFQHTLSNNMRVDCFLRMPNNAPGIAIDSKFPHEGFELFRKASNDAERKAAAAQVRTSVLRHVKDISEKYLISGETQEPAFMFVPSESIYAELHDNFSNIIEQAHRARVAVVSPNILLLAITTMKTIIRDARMQNQSKLIQREVGLLLRDVNAMLDHIRKWRDQLNRAEGNMKEALDYRDQIANRVGTIERVDVEPSENSASATAAALPLLEASGPVN
jgi:DNA recombination protein RmuC